MTAELSRVTVAFAPYNTRRYGRPWIARVAGWPIGKPPELTFGSCVGLTAEIAARPGDIVRWGQRDHRRNDSTKCWGIVQTDLSVREYLDPVFCRRHWLAGCPVPSDETERPDEADSGNVMELKDAWSRIGPAAVAAGGGMEASAVEVPSPAVILGPCAKLSCNET